MRSIMWKFEKQLAEEGSWIGSVNCLGSFICYIIYGYLISSVGSKRATLLLTIPSLLGWSLIYLGDNYYYVLLGRFLGGGVSGAATATVSLYVTEISNDKYDLVEKSCWILDLNLETIYNCLSFIAFVADCRQFRCFRGMLVYYSLIS